MRTAIPLTVFAAAFACSLATAPAHARARVFVASYGNDANPCTFASPCRNFQQAVNVVDAAGEVTAIDSAGFGPINITKPVTITSPDGVEAGIVPAPGGNAINIDVGGVGVSVFLRGLTLEGANSGYDGISVSGNGTINIVHCVVQHFTHDGIEVQPTSFQYLSILDTIVADNGWTGIDLEPTGAGGIYGVIDHSRATGNHIDGISVWGANADVSGATNITIANSVASNNLTGNGVRAYTTQTNTALAVVVRGTVASGNAGAGFFVDGTASMFIRDSNASTNLYGINASTNAHGWSFGDNDVVANFQQNVVGTWTSFSFH